MYWREREREREREHFVETILHIFVISVYHKSSVIMDPTTSSLSYFCNYISC